MKKNLAIMAAIAATFFSCATPEPEAPVKKDNVKKVELTASASLSESGGWIQGDALSMIDSRGNHRFSTSGSGEKAEFSGEAVGAATQRRYYYPYDGNYELRGDTVVFELPSRQIPGDRSLLVSAAQVSMGDGTMQDAVTLVKFTPAKPGMKSAKFVSPSGEILSGRAAMTFTSAGRLEVTPLDGSSEITVAPGSGEFEAGKEYCFAAFPCVADSLVCEYDGVPAETPDGPEPPSGLTDIDIELVFIETPSSTTVQWPFATPSSGSVSSSYNTASFPGKETVFTMPESQGGYSFRIYATNGIAKNGGGSQGLKFGGAKGDYIELPALNGLYLTGVTLVSGGKSSVVITGVDGTPVHGGDDIPSFSGLGDSYSWALYGTGRSVPYRMAVASDGGGIYIQRLRLHYSTSAVAYVDPSDQFLEVLPDTIPDFSRVGYHFGDREIPDVPVRMTLEAPSDGSDALGMINDAISKVETPGAILLKAGTYNVSGSVRIARDGVVLRGEGEDKTILYCTATTQVGNVVQIGNTDARSISSTNSPIIAKYVPTGQMWVPVRDPGRFAVGDKVFVYRPATNEWLDAIHMREISDQGTPDLVQWTASSYSIYWERHVTAIEGYRIYLDNPIVMGIGGYGITGYLYKGSWKRVKECGLENLTIDTRYDASKKSGSDYIDEDHAWSGVTVRAAENCWVRNVTTKHIGYETVGLATGAYKVTVENCTGLLPVSQVTGSRRYAFHFSGSQACLIRNCSCNDDRHQYVCGARVPGPNVFYNCVATKARSEAGPHQRWTTGVLYDNVKVSGALNIHDRAQYGTGHGWTSVTVVLYNCEAGSIVCQMPWASARNWAIGCIGTHKNAARTYTDNLGPRPEAIWISEGTHVSPKSLYLDQLEKRHAAGVWLDK